MVIGYMVIPGTWSIFAWSRTKWHFIQQDIPDNMVNIPDTWSIFEAPVLHQLHGEVPEAGALHGGVVVPVG